MWKKRILCLVLVVCAALVMTACQQKETFPTSPVQQEQTQQQEAPAQNEQNIFGDTPVPQQINFDDGSYDPTSEEGGNEEMLPIDQTAADGTTPAPTIKSEYAGATPVLIDMPPTRRRRCISPLKRLPAGCRTTVPRIPTS